ncbi:MAG: hypothetical protein IPO43_10180 [Rhodoferax sp.]|nr:hypothetical protein [Rhodoferax sp.]
MPCASTSRILSRERDKHPRKKVILDFRTPVVSRFVFDAIEEAIACPEAAFVDELVIVDDAAT